MNTNIGRSVTMATLTIAQSAAVSNYFDFRDYAGGVVLMPAAWTSASIGFYVCSTSGGTFLPLYNENGALVQISSPAASKAYSLPAALFGGHFVKLWSQNGSGTDTTQTSARSVVVTFKG